MADVYSPIVPATPQLSGLSLKCAVALFESPIGPYVSQQMLKYRVPRLLQILRGSKCNDDLRPTLNDAQSVDDVIVESLDAHDRLEAALLSLDNAGTTRVSTASNARPTILDYHFAYEHKLVTPNDVAERLISFLEAHNSKHRWLSAWSSEDIRTQAAAAAERYAAGKSLSILDGVPFCVKDAIDALPYETSFGTSFMGKLHPVASDAPAVATLKELGAILIGKAALNEFGALPHGCNARAGSSLNPHDQTRITGGSSAGSAAAVAVGLCPIAIGTDGGGSIRIPSSYCGVVGLKPTHGRLADDHGAHGAYASVIVSGPIANSVPDLTLLYAIMANIDYPKAAAAAAAAADTDADNNSSSKGLMATLVAAAAAAGHAKNRALGLPKALIPLRDKHGEGDNFVIEGLQPLNGLRVGVYKQWNAACSPAVAEVLQQSVDRLTELGATVVDIVLPELDLVQAGHLVTFGMEMAASAEQQGWLRDWSLRTQLNLDTRLFFAMVTNFTDDDYTQAQRLRSHCQSHFDAAFKQCDVIITPATPTAAPRFPPGANTTGVYDLPATLETVRFLQPANLLGLPALVVPGGRQIGVGLPIGVQFIGKPFAESTLLRTAAALEQHMAENGMPKPVPGLHINPIQCEVGAHPRAAELTKKLWAKRYNKK